MQFELTDRNDGGAKGRSVVAAKRPVKYCTFRGSESQMSSTPFAPTFS
jgi:hypothetical protein